MVKLKNLAEKIDSLYIGPEGYWTDGKVLVAGPKPAKAKSSEKKVTLEQIRSLLDAATHPAKLLYYYYYNIYAEVLGISGHYILNSDKTTDVFAIFKVGDNKYYQYDALRLAVIINRMDNIIYGISDDGNLHVKINDNDNSALLLPCQFYDNQLYHTRPPSYYIAKKLGLLDGINAESQVVS